MSRRFERGNYLFLTGVTVGLLGGVLVDRFLESEEWRLFQTVRVLAKETFVEEVDERKMFHDSLAGMIGGLDRHSRFYSPEEVAALDRETTGEFRGIGVIFRPPSSAGQVLFPYPGSPAARAGIRVGDTIVTVDGVALADLAEGGLQAALQRPERESVELVVDGLDGRRRTTQVRPESVVDPSVRHATILDAERGLGYLAILSFSHRTPDEWDAAVTALQDQGLERLIVDLRGNPGGILEAAVLLANRFVPEGPLVLTETRSGTRVDEADPARATLAGMPLVLLVDRNSASASEVLAGCLQDYGAAVLVGEPTYGKGTVQTLNRIEEKQVVVKLTTAVYYTPLLRRIERGGSHAGIAPDVAVPLDEDERARIYRHLWRYPVPDEARPALEAWQARSGETLLPEAPEDRQLALAVDLLTGELAASR